MTLEEAIGYAESFLQFNGIEEADFKALSVVCSTANIKNSQYQLNRKMEIPMKAFADKLWLLKSGEPLQYVLGEWDFYNSTFFVGRGVLIPRPETEELVAKAIECAKQIENPVILDLCAGSGCIGLSIAKEIPNSSVYLIEKSSNAFKYLEKNAKGVSNAKIIKRDIFENIDVPLADIIVSNPPYIPTNELGCLQEEVKKEPIMALDGGADGLDFYRRIISFWSDKIKVNGTLFFEIGENQGDAVSKMMTFDFHNIEVVKDIYNNDRIVIANKS